MYNRNVPGIKGSPVLIFGGNTAIRNSIIEKILFENLELGKYENNPDILIIEPLEGKKSIGITRTRFLTKFVSQKPISFDIRAVIVPKADLLTVAAQNSLLKTLEELPNYSVVLLNTKTQGALLETVISRCKRIDANKWKANGETAETTEEKKATNDRNRLKKVLEMNTGERLAWADTVGKEDRQDVIEMLERWGVEGREALKDEPNKAREMAKNIEDILEIKQDLEQTNVNLRLAIETLAIKLA